MPFGPSLAMRWAARPTLWAFRAMAATGPGAVKSGGFSWSVGRSKPTTAGYRCLVFLKCFLGDVLTCFDP